MQTSTATRQSWKKKVLFVIGKDRPGIVRHVAQYLTDRGASIEDSRMAVMGGLFSMTIMVAHPGNSQPHSIEQDTHELTGADLSCHFHPVEHVSLPRDDQGATMHLEIQCMDHVGVVKQVVRVLHEHEVNIRSMDTGMHRAPFFGTPIFHLAAEIVLPPDASPGRLHEDMAVLAAEEDLDISLVMADHAGIHRGFSPQVPAHGSLDAFRSPEP